MAAIARTQEDTVTWNIDPSHTDVQFAVRHMGLFNVKGHFEKATGTVETNNGELSRFDATIDAASINTRSADRDAHLRSADFFDAEKYPTLEFKSTQVTPLGKGHYKAVGDLTIAGQTHPVEFDVQATDPVTDPWGNRRAGAVATGEISRKAWGLTWNQVLETGSLLVSDEVKITIDVEVVQA